MIGSAATCLRLPVPAGRCHMAKRSIVLLPHAGPRSERPEAVLPDVVPTAVDVVPTAVLNDLQSRVECQ